MKNENTSEKAYPVKRTSGTGSSVPARGSAARSAAVNASTRDFPRADAVKPAAPVKPDVRNGRGTQTSLLPAPVRRNDRPAVRTEPNNAPANAAPTRSGVRAPGTAGRNAAGQSAAKPNAVRKTAAVTKAAPKPSGKASVSPYNRPVTAKTRTTVPEKRDTRFDTSTDWKRAERTANYAPPTFEGAPRVYSPKKDQTTPAERRADRSMQGRLRAQAPTRRREEKRLSRRVDVTEMKRRNVREEFRLKKEEESRRKLFFRRAAVVLVLYAIVMAIIGVFIAGNLIVAAAKNRDNVFIHISYKTDPRYVKRTQKYASVFRDGVMYVSMTDIAMLGDLATTGDADELRYLTSDGQYITLAVGGETATVNGVRVRLDRRTYKENGMFYVPATFIERYVGGISITYDDTQEKMTILRDQTTNEYAETVDAPLFFRLSPDTEQPPVSEAEFDRLLKERNL
ncbi:MAG: stalk domain-containing protein [Lachnospiraceae bacterium]|nr:stalk domain-containing protein [Lachnospiraceae bacterium]